MAGVRRRFSREFKVGAVKLVTEQGYSTADVARRLDIDRKSIQEWLVKFAPEFDASTADQELPEDPQALQEELRRLRRENDRLRMERDILKKAAAYFAKDDLP
jgi:transposase